MTDLFGEWVSDEQIDRMFAVMALAPISTSSRCSRNGRSGCTAGAAFFFKQWGAFTPIIGRYQGGRWDGAPFSEAGPETLSLPERKNGYSGWEFPDGQVCMRVGKKYAGRLLDGRTWDEFPKTEAVHA
jgi:hypothetical protein